jgi:uncharacterized protein
MGRIFSWLMLALVVFLGTKWLKTGQKPPAQRTSGAPAAQNMVCCAQCGLNVPQSEAVAAGGRWYCCEQHRLDHGARA